MTHDMEFTTTIRVPLTELHTPDDIQACKQQLTEQANTVRAETGLPPVTLTFREDDTHLITDYVRQVITDQAARS